MSLEKKEAKIIKDIKDNIVKDACLRQDRKEEKKTIYFSLF